MPHELRLTRGTGVTVLSNTEAYRVTEYVPTSPTLTITDILDSIQNGRDGEITVTETLEMLIGGATRIEVQNNVQTLQRQVEMFAPLWHQRKQGTWPVFLEMRLHGETTWHRSQILTGRLELDDASLRTIYGLKVEARLIITRRYFWERADEVELAINSEIEQSTVAVGGKFVANGASNYVNVPAANAGGSLPAPLKIELRNFNGMTGQFATRMYGSIYMANEIIHGTQAGLSTRFGALIQAETQVTTGSGQRVFGYTGASNNAALRVDLSAGGVAFPRWDKPGTQVQAATGQAFRLLVRFPFYSNTLANPIYVEPRLIEPGGATANVAANLNPYATEIGLPYPNELVDVGTIAFGDYPLSSGMQIVLALRSAVAARVDIDYLQPMPANNFRQLVYTGQGVPQNGRIIDDGIEERAYQLNESGQQIPVVSTRGRPIMLWPGRLNSIYFLQDSRPNMQALIGDGFYVRLWYRPRRLTI